MITYLAHAGEQHIETSESVLHTFESWPVALLIWAASLIVIGTLAYIVSKKNKAFTAMILGIALLGFGILLYEASAVISIVSLTIGLGLTLLFVLTMLSKPDNS